MDVTVETGPTYVSEEGAVAHEVRTKRKKMSGPKIAIHRAVRSEGLLIYFSLSV